MSRIPPKKKALLDHSIVGQKATSLTIRKERNLAACRICGAIFQPVHYIKASDEEYYSMHPIALDKRVEAERQILEWRAVHNKTHSDEEHLKFATSGLTFTPEAAQKLAPFGLVPVGDATMVNVEVGQALAEAPRVPHNDVETTLKRPPERRRRM